MSDKLFIQKNIELVSCLLSPISRQALCQAIVAKSSQYGRKTTLQRMKNFIENAFYFQGLSDQVINQCRDELYSIMASELKIYEFGYRKVGDESIDNVSCKCAKIVEKLK